MTQTNVTVAVFNETSGWTLPKMHVERIRDAAGPDSDVRQVSTHGELLNVLPETHHLIGFPLTEEVFGRVGSNVKWIQLTNSAGDTLGSLADVIRRGVRVTTAATVRAPQIAEHAIALALALVRGLDRSIRFQDEHHWATNTVASESGSLTGATVGLVSLGTVGHEMACRLKPFGVHLVTLNHQADDPYFDSDMTLPFSEIDELMTLSDIVIVAAPRLPSMESLIGRRQLKRLKRSSILVNVSRGGVVDEDALIEALRRRRIAGAGLDVFETEPLPTTSPFWTMPNVIVTPHVGAASPNYWQQAVDMICHNLHRIHDERPLIDEMTIEWFDRSFT